MSIVAMVTQFHFIICDKMSLFLKSIVNKYYIEYIIRTNNFFFCFCFCFSSNFFFFKIHKQHDAIFTIRFLYLLFYFFFFLFRILIFFALLLLIHSFSFSVLLSFVILFHFNLICTPYWDESKKKKKNFNIKRLATIEIRLHLDLQL